MTLALKVWARRFAKARELASINARLYLIIGFVLAPLARKLIPDWERTTVATLVAVLMWGRWLYMRRSTPAG